MRSVAFAILGAIAGLLAPVGIAANFGGHTVNSGCCAMYGSRADIGVPCCDFTLPFAVAGAVRVSSEHGGSLIQVGFAQTNSISTGNCGSSPSLSNYYEIITVTGFESCLYLGGPGYGTVHRYSTYRSTTTSSTTTWKAAIDGVTQATFDLGFDVAWLTVASGELTGTGNTGSGHVYGCYGCNGNLGWQRATAPGGSQWYTVQQSNPLNDDTRWTIGTTPSPFAVSHPYP